MFKKLKKWFLIWLTASSGWIILILVLAVIVYSLMMAIVGKEYNAAQIQNKTNYVDMDGMPPWVTPEIISICLQLQDTYGIYASVTIAQAQLEAGGTWNGESLYDTASKDFNLFGFKASGSLSEWNGEVTWDGTHGWSGTYRKYTSFTQGIKDRARIMLTSRLYADVAVTCNTSSDEQLRALAKSPWCEGKYSVAQLQSNMDRYRLTRLDSMTYSDYISGGGTFDGTFVYYNQADPQWGALPYVRGESISSSGCAATSLAMIWATYSKNTSITPITIFDIGNGNGALNNGWLARDGCVTATNTDISFGCTATHTLDWDVAEEAISKGGCAMLVGCGSQPFTLGGHWIVIIGIDGETAYLADPGHRACTWTEIGGNSTGESLSYIKKQTQDMIIFTPR